jgi:hypothetical protein
LTHFHKLITSKLPPSLAHLIAAAHPELVPALEVLSETIDDAIKFKIETAVDRVSKNATNNPTGIGSDIDGTAQRVAEDVAINVRASEAQAAVNNVNNLRAEIKAEAIATADIERSAQRLEHGKIDRILAQLRSPSASQREQAIDLLAKNSGKLSEVHIQKLRAMMRGNQSWQTGRNRPEGHHCTDYEYKRIGYYAGRALQQIESPYVDSSLKAEAQNAESNGSFSRKVTDPGWI